MESAPSESALIPTRRLTVLSRQVCANRDKNCEGEAFYSPNNVPTFHPCGASAYYSEFDHNFKYSPTMYSFPRAAHDDLLNLEALLTPAERDVKNQARAWAEKTVAPVIADYWERAAFPFVLVPELAKVKTGLGSILSNSKGVPSTASPAAAPTSLMAGAMAMFEMGRVDASLGTFFLVHGHLACNTIALMGSQNLDASCPNAPAFSTSGFYDPKKPKNVHPHQYLLEDMCAIKKVGCWALTEPGRGSDASAVETTATPCVDSQGRRGYKLNGAKRWIGNGTWADASCIWAKNTETGQVNCFLVPKGAKGLELTKIENKIALRCVQNADMKFVDCFVPEIDRLPGATSFKDTSRVLAISRVMVAWLPVAMAAGAYDFALRYVGSREQFGSSIASYQLVQERLARMLAIIQSCWLMCWRVTRLLEDGKLSHAAAAAAKAHCTKNCREAVGLGREILGGNGILSHFHLAKVYCDMEAIYTYEGTYDVNVLVVGRDVTGGVSAFKNKNAAESQAKKKAQKK